MSRERGPESPWGILLAGALTGMIGITLWALLPVGFPELIGYLVMWLGGVLTSIGVVGVGVTMGTVRADWELSRH